MEVDDANENVRNGIKSILFVSFSFPSALHRQTFHFFKDGLPSIPPTAVVYVEMRLLLPSFPCLLQLSVCGFKRRLHRE